MSWQKVAQPFCPTKPWVRTEALRKAGLRLAAEDLAQQVGAAQVAILGGQAFARVALEVCWLRQQQRFVEGLDIEALKQALVDP